ncbi:MAG: sigma-54-dependent Fis family transcriptional regulator [Myxococcales bacterium]|nr:sigma-54-dependent Fis family transcriptional regulator [Myxococcales bacterium]
MPVDTPLKATTLVVDDSEDSRELARRHLSAHGHTVRIAASVEEAVELLALGRFDLVVTDMRMPNASGLELVRYVHENFAATAVMVITGFPDVDNAVSAVKFGADEYLGKPYTELELIQAAQRALRGLTRRVLGLDDAVQANVAKHGMIGISRPIRQVFAQISRVAASNAGVLLTGESGVGKELVARAIHVESSRRQAPLVPVNCGAIPQELFESELFGHARGAFTGANTDHPGFFQASDGGTLFLDEVSELGPKLQVKLLRVLQDRQVYMLGATRPRKVDVRIIAATSRDLAAMISEGTFREDLFYRLSVVTIDVPPLRERGDDLILLARHFLARFADEQDRPPPELSEPAICAMEAHSWPGNVRELENLMHHLVVMADRGRIDVVDLPPHMRHLAPASERTPRALEQVEREHIQKVLDSVSGNRTQAARVLGIDRKTLREKLKPR